MFLMKQTLKKLVGTTTGDFINAFAFYVFTVVMLYVFLVTFTNIPKDNVRFADTALGFLLAQGINLIVVWAFRTSKSAMDEKAVKFQKEIADDPPPDDNKE